MCGANPEQKTYFDDSIKLKRHCLGEQMKNMVGTLSIHVISHLSKLHAILQNYDQI